MNCQTFDSFLLQLTNGEITDTAERETLLAHAEACAKCGGQLVMQRKLTNDLVLLRDQFDGAGAPPRLELALRESFRRHAASASNPAAALTDSSLRTVANSASVLMFDSHERVSPPASFFQALRRHAALVSATAAAVIIVAAASLSGNLQRETRTDLVARVDGNRPSESVVKGIGADAPIASGMGVESKLAVGVSPDEFVGSDEILPITSLPARRDASIPPMSRSNGRMTSAKSEFPLHSSTPERQSPQVGADGRLPFSEIATEFLPLVEAESLASVESGQIVRVELPRQALVALGLPMNSERANELVKADVLLGEDGIARAIRFIR